MGLKNHQRNNGSKTPQIWQRHITYQMKKPTESQIGKTQSSPYQTYNKFLKTDNERILKAAREKDKL